MDNLFTHACSSLSIDLRGHVTGLARPIFNQWQGPVSITPPTIMGLHMVTPPRLWARPFIHLCLHFSLHSNSGCCSKWWVMDESGTWPFNSDTPECLSHISVLGITNIGWLLMGFLCKTQKESLEMNSISLELFRFLNLTAHSFSLL